MGIPTKEEMRKEAVRRLETAGVSRRHIEEFSKDGTVPFVVDSIAAEYGRPTPDFRELVSRIEGQHRVLIYYGIETVTYRLDETLGTVYTLLYVPADRSEWDENVSLTLGEQKAYVCIMAAGNPKYPETGGQRKLTVERVLIKNFFGGLVRIR